MIEEIKEAITPFIKDLRPDLSKKQVDERADILLTILKSVYEKNEEAYIGALFGLKDKEK